MGGVQEQVQQAVDRLVESGVERGVQVAVYRNGEPVVDVTTGAADPATGRPVDPGTPFHNFSIGKGVTAAVVHVLAERGALDYDTRVAELWPEFAAHGKDAVTVRHVLTHSAGVPGLPAETTPEELCDWEGMCAVIAGSELWWTPGTRVGYHAYTFGHIVGEVVRRATGAPIAQVLGEEVAGPLGIADELFYGMPVSEHHRLARLEDAEGTMEALAALPDDAPMFAVTPRGLAPTALLGERGDVLAADVPACAKTSARAIARVYASLMGDGVDGVRLIAPERLRTVTAVAATGVDQVFGNPSTWGLGYALGRPGADPRATASVFGMGGAGGSLAYGDTATGIAFALTKNRLSGDFATATRISDIVAACAADS